MVYENKLGRRARVLAIAACAGTKEAAGRGHRRPGAQSCVFGETTLLDGGPAIKAGPKEDPSDRSEAQLQTTLER